MEVHDELQETPSQLNKILYKKRPGGGAHTFNHIRDLRQRSLLSDLLLHRDQSGLVYAGLSCESTD